MIIMQNKVTFIYLYCLSNTGAGHPYFNATLFMHMVDIFKHYLEKIQIKNMTIKKCYKKSKHTLHASKLMSKY